MKNVCIMFIVSFEWQGFVLQACNIPGSTKEETDTKKVLCYWVIVSKTCLCH